MQNIFCPRSVDRALEKKKKGNKLLGSHMIHSTAADYSTSHMSDKTDKTRVNDSFQSACRQMKVNLLHTV